MKRLSAGSCTDALMEALEHVEDMQHVVVLFEPVEGHPGGFFTDGQYTAAESLWLATRFISFLTRHPCACEVDEDGDGA